MKVKIILRLLLLVCAFGATAHLSWGQKAMSIIDDYDRTTKNHGPRVRKNIRLAELCMDYDLNINAYDYYYRALRGTKDEESRIFIHYMLGNLQVQLDHPEEAYKNYKYVYDRGERGETFLKSYIRNLCNLSMYKEAESIYDTMAHYKQNTHYWRNMLDEIKEIQDTSYAFSREDAVYDTGVNSHFSEYGLSFYEDRLVFASTRPIHKHTLPDPKTGHSYSNLFVANYVRSSKSWEGPELLEGPFFGLAQEGNLANFCFDANRDIAYFTYARATYQDIFWAQRYSDGTWSDPQKFELNYLDGHSSFDGKAGHPSISPDGNRLLFVFEDLEKGTSADIYVVERTEKTKKLPKNKNNAPPAKNKHHKYHEKKKKAAPKKTSTISTKKKKAESVVRLNADWETPIRLDAVSTKGRESFPQWLDAKSFSFASDGLPGLGGQDIYVAVINEKNVVEEIQDLLPPINSSFDDHSLIVDEIHKQVVFASNRNVSPGERDNIYVYSKGSTGVLIEGEVVEANTNRKIERYDIKLNGGTVYNLSPKIKEKNRFAFPAVKPTNYFVKVEASGYEPESVKVNCDDSKSLLPILTRKKIQVKLKPSRGYSKYDNSRADSIEKADSIRNQNLRNRLGQKDALALSKDTLALSAMECLQFVPRGVRCVNCAEYRQREVGKISLIRTLGDKAYVKFTDNLLKTHSIVDLAQNTSYSVEVNTLAETGLALPKSLAFIDLIKTTNTKDYIIYEGKLKISDQKALSALDAEAVDLLRKVDRMLVIVIKNTNMMCEYRAYSDDCQRGKLNPGQYTRERAFEVERIAPRLYTASGSCEYSAKAENENRLNKRYQEPLFIENNPRAVASTQKPSNYEAKETVLHHSDEVYFKLQLGAYKEPVADPEKFYADIIKLHPQALFTYYIDTDKLYKYNLGDTFKDINEVRALAKRVSNSKHDCYIVAFYKGKRVTVSEAISIINQTKK